MWINATVIDSFSQVTFQQLAEQFVIRKYLMTYFSIKLKYTAMIINLTKHV